MFQRLRRTGRATLVAIGLSSAVLLSFSQVPAATAAESCDRACLTGLLTQYVDAVVARDHSKLPLAEKVRVTEDSKAIKLGEGLWQISTMKGTFRHDYLDVKKQIAATHVHLLEGKTNVLL